LKNWDLDPAVPVSISRLNVVFKLRKGVVSQEAGFVVESRLWLDRVV